MHEAGAVEEHVDRADGGGERVDRLGVAHVERFEPRHARLFRPSSFAGSTSVAITSAPSRANASAVARPMPCPAAVRNARLPSSRPIPSPLPLCVHLRPGRPGPVSTSTVAWWIPCCVAEPRLDGGDAAARRRRRRAAHAASPGAAARRASRHACDARRRRPRHALSRSSAMALRSTCGGAPSSRISPDSRISRQALPTRSSATSTESSGSAGSQPVARMMSAAAIAATEPRRSPSTCRMAPREIERRLVAAVQHEEDDDVDQEPDAPRSRASAPPRTGAGVTTAVDRLDHDPERDAEHRQPVGVGDEDFQPVEAVGHAAGPRPIAHPVGDIGEHQRDGIRQHVAGIGEQRQRAGEEPAGRLGEHEAAGEHGDEDAPPVARQSAWRRVPWSSAWS